MCAALYRSVLPATSPLFCAEVAAVAAVVVAAALDVGPATSVSVADVVPCPFAHLGRLLLHAAVDRDARPER